ncbi:AbrB/MazE/SpoVT family DNA-binding domain-containing protein [Pseudonocardia nigra]|uniref:AbrB/MazE/SpoVT family DNA-binding domain-containing protein n=1 Tax=Pseudonocardia nigra TaxID=1921578 RepID=UPI001C5D76C2|nr:AbrB/MazE/SpoVT family DNA-binding domain-containing protein [Pseudonocardia nigra]
MSESESVGLGSDVLVNHQGRVTIPAQIRREAGIEAGTPLVVYVEDGRVVMETREQLAQRTRREVAASWSGEGSVVEELLAERRVEAAREDER